MDNYNTVIIVFLIILVYLKFNKFEGFNINKSKSKLINSQSINKDWFSDEIKDIKNMKRKKNILVLSAGPSLNELDYIKKYLTKDFLNETYIICVKSAINKVKYLNIPIDFLVINGESSFHKINKNLLNKQNLKNTKVFCIKDDERTSHNTPDILDDICNYKVYINKNNSLECVIDDLHRNCFGFKLKKDNTIETNWGHMLSELIIPICILLKPKNILTLGYDIEYKNSTKIHWNSENFTDYKSKEFNINHSYYLEKYLKKYYGINIFKLSKKSGVKIPYLDPREIKNL